jgi:hypothetical protein
MRFTKLSEIYDQFKQGTWPGTEGLSEAHRATEFAVFLMSGVNKLMINSYNIDKGIECVNFELTKVDSQKALETYVNLGGPEMIDERMASGEFIRVGFNKESVSLFNKEWGGIIEIDQFLIDTDQTNEIKAMAMKLGESAARRKWYEAYTLFNNGTSATCYDAVYVFAAAAADHPNVTGGAANTDNTNSLAAGAFTEANLEAALQNINLWKGIYGEILNIKPVGVLTGSTGQFDVERILTDATRMSPAAGSDYGHNKNIFQNRGIQPFFDNGLTAASWYVKTDIPGFLLQQFTPLEIQEEPANSGESFNTRTYRRRVYESYAVGVVNWRAYLKGN